MEQGYVDKSNYDVVSISQQGKAKRANYVQDAMHIERERVASPSQFVKVFSDIFLKREAGKKAII
ncbi:hypothetical protein A3H09_00290 [Candidatus Falkowbacteria bacterium RIFCSPLOWO2_12_FULL_45_13]|uniref:Uncharacterized protein n=2 Tax=Bacteria TaxID=2 RepID=A0A1F4RAW9_UNCSA|nr:MAG: hypothetical protein A3J44_04745 [candidate division WOR-1 bacterium RIFCSPHIGHO2_02_FULL_45_12]OGC05310.1 MAG: hypothetical protein A3H38_02590 [candidate division WOR-1 bacterium RIFCSPLOWO2_02_FULL_46_20]OGF32119.1 MAG: hypothetical protein A3H09_00290 [Candidatus Falkowbacteria bacterium RIFCSPLOWO2_12_FULL_45_13]